MTDQHRKLETLRENMKLQYLLAPDDIKLRFYRSWRGGWRLLQALTVILVVGTALSLGYLAAHPYMFWPRLLFIGLVMCVWIAREVYDDMDKFLRFLKEHLPDDYRPIT